MNVADHFGPVILLVGEALAPVRDHDLTWPCACRNIALTRSGIDLPTRDLLTFGMLGALGGCDPQVKGHVSVHGSSRA
jgi:alkylhydroperoxidase/carboxymuconolactone decarboxylase family protein YurZ